MARHVALLRLSFRTTFLLALAISAGPNGSQAFAEAPVIKGETFELPEDLSTVENLMSFVQEIDALEPDGQDQEQMLTHQRKVARTVVLAAEKLATTSGLGDEAAMQATFLKLQGLRILDELGEPQADELMEKAIAAAQADKRADVRAVGTKFLIESGFSKWATWNEEQRNKLIDNIISYVTNSEPQASQVDLLMAVVDFLGDMDGEQQAGRLMDAVMPHFKKAEDPRIQQVLVMLEGIQRRMNLPGNSIDLEGKMLDGSTLDWASYRGKVVLVDFWATWCGPCRAEVPNVLKMYEAYHDKGFEVLGISLDERREQAESYIQQTSIPWATMFSDQAGQQGWQHPMAVRYGITGIPRAILVDREGKVVHMTARGEILGRELRRLLGEPVAKLNNSADSFVQQVSATVSE